MPRIRRERTVFYCSTTVLQFSQCILLTLVDMIGILFSNKCPLASHEFRHHGNLKNLNFITVFNIIVLFDLALITGMTLTMRSRAALLCASYGLRLNASCHAVETGETS